MTDKRGTCYIFSEKNSLYYLYMKFPSNNKTIFVKSPPFNNNPQTINSTLEEIAYQLVFMEDSVGSGLPSRLINNPPPQQISEILSNIFDGVGVDYLYTSKELNQKEFDIINNKLNEIYVKRFLSGIHSLVNQASGEIKR